MPAETPDRPRVFIDRVHLKGFKSVKDLSIDFQKGLNVLIGKNGSGKSNFMECLSLVVAFKSFEKLTYDFAKLDFSSNDNHKFSLELEKRHSKSTINPLEERIGLFEKFTIDNELKFNSADDKGFIEKIFSFKDKTITYPNNLNALFLQLGYGYVYPTFLKYDLPDNLNFISIPEEIHIRLDTPFVLWNYPDSLSFIDTILWSFDFYYQNKGLNVIREITKAEVLERLKLNDLILANLKIFSPIEDVRFSPNINIYKDENLISIDNVRIEFNINGSWLPWSQLSDGTKRLFYIIAEITNSIGLILMEEPELGIHPHQFNLLMDFLKEQSQEKQIIISTHSPKALDHLNPDELNNILITYYDLNRKTQIRHLTEKEITKAKKYMKEVGFFSDYWLLSDLEE